MLPLRPRPARSLRALPRRLPRSALPWWLAVVGLAALTFTVVRGAETRAAEAEARWRTTRTVLVSTRRIDVGDRLDGATVVRRLPVAAVPRHALTASAAGRVAVAPIDAGEVVSRVRVSGGAAAGTAARLPPGARAVLVPLEVAGLPLAAGDRVDLLSTGESDLPAAAVPQGRMVARAALVLQASPRSLVVAVDPGVAVAVAAALGQGPLVPALVGPPA